MRPEERFGRDFATDYDIDDPRLAENWAEVVEDLHSRCPVARSNEGEGYWVINGYDDIRAAAGDWETFSSTSGFMPNRPEGMPFWYPVECDPPFHDELRNAINSHLGPKAIAGYEPGIREIANGLIDAFVGAGEIDAVTHFSQPLPGLVFCSLVAGIPREDMPFLSKTLNDGLLGPHEGRGQAMSEAQAFLMKFLEQRRGEPPRGDIVDAVLNVEIDGYEWEDRGGTLSQLTLGGVGTTGHVIASSVHHFARDVEARQRFVEDPAIRPRAVEEFVRIFAPSPHDGRRCTRDVEVAGTQMKEGDFVVFGYGAGSRDPNVSPNPSEVDFDRSPNRHVAFGAGVHRCIGSHLARLQTRVALEVLLERLPEFTVEEGFEPTYEQGITRSMLSLPIRFPAGKPLSPVTA
jgi:cytochrome P450